MRTMIMTAAVSAVAFGALDARAQSDDEMADDELQPEGSATVLPREPQVTQPASQSQHTVERGDTLWDLSQRYLGSPWYWPKVWSYNPEIANPHWIYPGNIVRFQGLGENNPTQIQVAEPSQMPMNDQIATSDDRVQVYGQIGYRVKPTINVGVPGIITKEEVQGFGRIAGSFAEHEMLTFPSRVFVKFDERRPKVGETYVVMRPAGEIVHPTTRRTFGFLTKLIGEVRVDRVDDKGVATVSIVRQHDPILRSDLVGPKGEPSIRSIASVDNERDIRDAVIVAALPTYLTTFAEHSIVIVDRGSDDGVKPGNTFVVWRQNDFLGQDTLLNPTIIDESYPREDVGQCLAVDVRSNATVCLVTKSIREIIRGDHIEMRMTKARTAIR